MGPGLGCLEVSGHHGVTLPDSKTHRAGRGGWSSQGPILGLTDSKHTQHRDLGWDEDEGFQGLAVEGQDLKERELTASMQMSSPDG